MLLPKTGTEELVDDSILRNHKNDRESYLGFSQIGEECERKIYYNLHSPVAVTDPRILRIFKVGHILETEIIKMLRDSGLTIYDLDENGKQFQVRYFNDQYRGSPDGIIMGLPESSVPHLLEIKTYNEKRFNTLKKDGVKCSDPKYFSQLQANMGAFDLTRSLFVAYNKNTSEMYYERVDYDPFDNALLMAKAQRILSAKDENDLDRSYPDSNFFKCKFCDYRKKCWGITEG